MQTNTIKSQIGMRFINWSVVTYTNCDTIESLENKLEQTVSALLGTFFLT